MKKKLLVISIAAIPVLMLNIAFAQFNNPPAPGDSQCAGWPNGTACSGGTCYQGYCQVSSPKV